MKRSRLILIGGGHAHAVCLRTWARGRRPEGDIVLISAERAAVYSGLVPSFVAGTQALDGLQINLPGLATAANTEFVEDRVVGLDLASRQLELQSGREIAFDFASFNIGGTSSPDAVSHRAGITIKPWQAFLGDWNRLSTRRSDPSGASQQPLKIAIVGAGPAGVELALAMRQNLNMTAAKITLIDRGAEVASFLPVSARVWLRRKLNEHGIEIKLDTTVHDGNERLVHLSDGSVIDVDRLYWITSARAPEWFAATDLALSERGFIRVDDTLRMTGHDAIFAAGDCADGVGDDWPKSGVTAVRHGRILATNLREAIAGRPPQLSYKQRPTLAIVGAGDRHAVAARGRWVFSGHWVWLWKQWLDRSFIKSFEF